jgi:hypothetical protein
MNIADAVRNLLFGNGDLDEQIDELKSSLEEYDGKKYICPNKLELISARLDHLEEYDYFCGDEWSPE